MRGMEGEGEVSVPVFCENRYRHPHSLALSLPPGLPPSRTKPIGYIQIFSEPWSRNRDIKGANLLVDSSGLVKLADFGMAKHVS